MSWVRSGENIYEAFPTISKLVLPRGKIYWAIPEPEYTELPKIMNTVYAMLREFLHKWTSKFLWGCTVATLEMSNTHGALQWYLKFRLRSLPQKEDIPFRQ